MIKLDSVKILVGEQIYSRIKQQHTKQVIYTACQQVHTTAYEQLWDRVDEMIYVIDQEFDFRPINLRPILKPQNN
jgi:hypothetical protein